MTKIQEIKVSESFINKRIAEFPTLYPNETYVLFDVLLSKDSYYYWDNGILVSGGKTDYPLQIDLELANSMRLDTNRTVYPYAYYSKGCPLDTLPDNLEESWFYTISIFLNDLGKYSPDDWEFIAKTKCFYNWGVYSNSVANEPSRALSDYIILAGKISNWKARLDAISYFQRRGKIDPETYMGIGI